MHSVMLTVGAAALVATVAVADSVKGSVIYTGKTGEHRATITHVFLVKGPDSFDPKKIGRLLIFSTQDLGDKLRACATMACAEKQLADGFSVGLDTTPFLRFWMTLDNSRVQTSGPANLKGLTPTTETPERLAGTLRFDSFGAKVDVQFDATLLKTFAK